jgi:hypothetical protein
LADEASPVEEPFEPISVGATATSPRASPTRVLKVGKVGAAGRAPAEAATLVCAITVAVTLGVACGLWVNARLAAAASTVPPQLLSDVPVAGQKAPAASAETESPTADYDESSSAADAGSSSPGSGEPAAVAEVLRTTPVETAEEEGAGKRGGGEDEPVASGTGAAAKNAKSPDEVPDVKKKTAAGQGKGMTAPCALYASANTLTVRGGDAASFVLGGPGGEGRVTVTTPDWSNIVVFPEGRTGGNGWVRYSVRSVSNRAGVYRVHFKTPCGSLTIPVTVTRP